MAVNLFAVFSGKSAQELADGAPVGRDDALLELLEIIGGVAVFKSSCQRLEHHWSRARKFQLEQFLKAFFLRRFWLRERIGSRRIAGCGKRKRSIRQNHDTERFFDFLAERHWKG